MLGGVRRLGLQQNEGGSNVFEKPTNFKQKTSQEPRYSKLSHRRR